MKVIVACGPGYEPIDQVRFEIAAPNPNRYNISQEESGILNCHPCGGEIRVGSVAIAVLARETG